MAASSSASGAAIIKQITPSMASANSPSPRKTTDSVATTTLRLRLRGSW